VRCGAGFGDVQLYLATRHDFAWYAWNVLELDARDIALHLGDQDGGELVRKLYGHPDAVLARERVRKAFANAPTTRVPLVAAGLSSRFESPGGRHGDHRVGDATGETNAA
jgi:hypothetical protein